MSLTWAQNTQLVDGIAAIVNDDIITITEVREAMLPETEQLSQQYSGLALDQQVKASFKRTLTGLVDAQLQLVRARNLNLRVSEEDVNQQIDDPQKQNNVADEQFLQLLKTRGLTLEAYKKQVAESLLITKVVNAEVRSRLTVLDTELQEVYRDQTTAVSSGRGTDGEPYPVSLSSLCSPSKMNNACVRRLRQCCSKCVMVESSRPWHGSIPMVPRLRQVDFLGTFRAWRTSPRL